MPLAKGESSTVILKYKIEDKSLSKKEIPLKVLALYGDDQVVTEKIKIIISK